MSSCSRTRGTSSLQMRFDDPVRVEVRRSDPISRVDLATGLGVAPATPNSTENRSRHGPGWLLFSDVPSPAWTDPTRPAQLQPACARLGGWLPGSSEDVPSRSPMKSYPRLSVLVIAA